jgi:hypothetical protein
MLNDRRSVMPSMDSQRLAMPIGEAIFTQRSTCRFRPEPVSVEDLRLIVATADRRDDLPGPLGRQRSPGARRRMAMNRLLGILAVVSALLLAGCGTVILCADFQSPPAGGLLPGPPDDDRLGMSGGTVVSAGALTLNSSSSSVASFISHPVQDPEAKKWIAWTGQLKSGEGPLNFWIAGHTLGVNEALPDKPFLKIGPDLVVVSEGTGPLPPPSSQPNSPLNQNGLHRVFVSLRPKSGTYWISIQQSGAAEIVFTGQMSQSTAQSLKGHDRVLMLVSFLGGGPSTPPGTGEYQMDDVSIKEVD